MAEDRAARDDCGHTAPRQCIRQMAACSRISSMQGAAGSQQPSRRHAQHMRPPRAAESVRSLTAGSVARCSSHRSRPWRSVRWRSGLQHGWLSLALLLMALLQHLAGAAAKHCTRFLPSGCHFTARHGEPVVYPACKSACHFEVDQELRCPFHSAGMFVTEEETECPDAFMEGSPLRPRRLPDCSHHCCRAQETVGAFLRKPTAAEPQKLLFQPGGERSCRYYQYSRAEVLAALQGGTAEDEHPGMDILVLGDSLMRQLFSRLVHMMRGHARVVDYKMHTHASYSVCQEADAFRTAPYNSNRTRLAARTDPDHLLSIVPSFFRAGSNVEPGMLCSRRPAAAIHYAHAPRWRDQVASLERIWPAITPHRRAVVVLSTGFAEKAAHVSQEYLDMLTELAGKVERVFVIGTPLARVSNEEWRAAYKARNTALEAWAAAAGPQAEYINFGMLAKAPGRLAAGAGNSWHYQCFLQWPSWKINKSRTAAEAGNYFRDRVYGRPIEGLIVTEDGHCADEMNRNIWQLIFNVLLGHRGRPATPDELAAAKCCGRSGTGENLHQGTV